MNPDPSLAPATMQTVQSVALPGSEIEYVWELATMFPAQGDWTEADYLNLTAGSNHRIEYTDGRLEFLPLPSLTHEILVRFLFLALYTYVDREKLGEVFSNGIRVKTNQDKFRLPDVVFLHTNNSEAINNRAWDKADLVMEVVSDDPKDRQRDYEQKLIDYAEGGVSEYWIVDYEKKLVLVHQFEGNKYVVRGEYTLEQQAKSVLFEGFSIDVTALFASADGIPE